MVEPWLQLAEDDLGNWIVVPEPGLESSLRARLEITIGLLGLNPRKVVQRRNEYVADFLANGYEYVENWVQERQPFVCRELVRIDGAWASAL